jgi:REP element-mobilizing transposase RayT
VEQALLPVRAAAAAVFLQYLIPFYRQPRENRLMEGFRPRDAIRAYRRNLPHLEPAHGTLFVTFDTINRIVLPPAARSIALEHCLYDHGSRFQLHAACVMPTHVHLLFTPLPDEAGIPYPLAVIMKGIKGASSRRINQLLGRKGQLWLDESFDHVLRSHESLREKGEYICNNPVRDGLVKTPDEWPWLWREWIEGSK